MPRLEPRTASLLVVLGLLIASASPAEAQRRIQYDTLADTTPAAISCGFCAGEKFGMVFRPLDAGGGLRPTDFPLDVNSLEIAVARTAVTGDILSGFMCMGADGGGVVTVAVEVFAGETAPRGSIVTQPESGAWTGETMVYSDSAELTLSTETTAGSMMYDVMFNTVDIGGIRVEAPNTYLRVAVSIPGGGTSSSCAALGLTPPGAVGIRDDDGRIEVNVGYIYALNPFGGLGGISQGWHWNEDPEIADEQSGGAGINGEWAIRVNVTPLGAPTPDAGTTTPDAGTTPMVDAGTTPMVDAGATTEMCGVDSDCGGGERCIEGTCRRVSCSAASDCVGGMTCVENMCRNLCSGDSECLGGEVCDTAMGHCVPAGSLDEGGCGCRTVARPTPGWAWTALLPVLGLLLRRRRSRS